MEQLVTAKLIIEMLGSPKEHLEKTLKDYVDSLEKDKNIRMVSKDIAEPTPTEQLFSAFAELEIEFKDAAKLIDFCFEAMPSSVEIIKPDMLSTESTSLSSLLNDLLARLHVVDMQMKKLSAQSSILERNATNTLHNFVTHLCKGKPMTVEEISAAVGIKSDRLKQFLDNLITAGRLKEEGGKYSA